MYFEVAYAVNKRTIGIYDLAQVNTGETWFANGQQTQGLQAFRQVYTISALPSATTATIPSNIPIDANTQFTHIYGTVQNGAIATAFTPWVIGTPNDAPYLRVNESTGNIEIITTTANWVGYSGIIVVEYILND